MAEDSNGPSAGDDNGSSQNRDGLGDGQQVVLEEARTTKNQQLSQIQKLDDQAIRTVRIGFVLASLLVGGGRLVPILRFGLFGALGTFSLAGSLVTSLFVYGTSRHFIGSRPDELPLDYSNGLSSTEAYVTIIDRYERGTVRNRRVITSSAVFLNVSRLLLAVAVILFIAGIASYAVHQPLEAYPGVRTFISNPASIMT